jgi:predicted amidohydrolase YtcJ
VPLNPFWVMYHFLTRDTISAGIYGENQAVTSREDVLRLITINYARLTDEADIKGSIEADKLADFVVLSADLMTIPAAQVEDLTAIATFVNGKKVYQDPDAPI